MTGTGMGPWANEVEEMQLGAHGDVVVADAAVILLPGRARD